MKKFNLEQFMECRKDETPGECAIRITVSFYGFVIVMCVIGGLAGAILGRIFN